MSAAVRIEDYHRKRLRGLLSQFRLSRAETATWLRALAEEFDPSEQYRQWLDVAAAVQCDRALDGPVRRLDATDTTSLARQRKSRLVKKLELRLLRAYPVVDPERVEAAIQLGLIPYEAASSDAAVAAEYVRIAEGFIDALRRVTP
jgi:hypothetical protein